MLANIFIYLSIDLFKSDHKDPYMSYDNVSVPAVISTFSGLPSRKETLSTPTSVGVHGQPCLSGTASKETGSCDIPQTYCYIFTIPMAIFHDSVEITTEGTSVARFLQYLLKTWVFHLKRGLPCKYWHLQASCDDNSCTNE